MSSFVIKIIAAVAMFIDHAGLILFPQYDIFRIIGRLSYPIYAYCIAEGFRFTKNRLSYFGKIFLLGAACQLVYGFVDDELYIGILLVFSFSIVIMTFTDSCKASFRGDKSAVRKLLEKLNINLSNDGDKILSSTLAVLSVATAFVLTSFIEFDYGFFGIMLPVFTSLFDEKKKRMVMFSAALLALCIDVTPSFQIQYWSLLTIPILAFYNGKRGKYRLKHFFYIFYPAHLVFLYAINMLL